MTPAHRSILDAYDWAVIGNLGFVWDGRVMEIRILCPESRMQELVSFDEFKAQRQRATARWQKKTDWNTKRRRA